jgi:hypothetical protein
VLTKDERHSSGFAESAIGEADAVSFDKLRRSGLMGVRSHDESFGFVNTIVAAVSSGPASRLIGTP